MVAGVILSNILAHSGDNMVIPSPPRAMQIPIIVSPGQHFKKHEELLHSILKLVMPYLIKPANNNSRTMQTYLHGLLFSTNPTILLQVLQIPEEIQGAILKGTRALKALPPVKWTINYRKPTWILRPDFESDPKSTQ